MMVKRMAENPKNAKYPDNTSLIMAAAIRIAMPMAKDTVAKE